MATIARMIVAMGADPTGLRRGLNQGVREMQQFARSAAAIGARSNIFGNLNTPAKQAAASAVRAMQDQFGQDMADLREQLAQNLIDEKTFQDEGRNAARRFNDGLTQTLESLGNQGILTPQIAAGISSQYKNLGENAARDFQRGFERLTQLTRSTGLATRRIGTELTAAVTLPIIGAATASLRFANEFNRAMGNIESIIPGTGKRIYELRDAVRAVADETNQRAVDVASGLYLIISTFGDTARSVDIMEDVAKVSVAGLSDMESSVELLASVTRGFGDVAGETTRHVSDLAFETVKWGVVTIPQLGASIGRVVPIANELGISLEEMFATFATATGVTGDASEVATQLRGILKSLQDPSERLKTLYAELGVASGKAAVEQFGLIGVVDRIRAAYEGSGLPIADFIHRVEGQILALSLSGEQAETYRTRLEQMGNAAGATARAFEAQTQGIAKQAFQMQGLARRLEEMGERLGTAIGPALLRAEPAIQSFLQALIRLVESFAKLSPDTQAFILQMLAVSAAIGPIIFGLGVFITTLASVARTLLLARTAGITFAAVMGALGSPIFLIGTAIASVIFLLVQFSDEIDELGRALDQWIVGMANKARTIPLIGEAIADALEFLAGPAAVQQAKEAGEKVAQTYTQSLLNDLGQPRVQPQPIQMPDILKGAGIRRPEPIVLIDPKVITQQVQTAIDQLELFQEAGRSIRQPFQELERLQGVINARLEQGRLTVQDEMELTRSMLNIRRQLGDAAGTSVGALSQNMGLVIEQLELAQQTGRDLAGPMQAVRDIMAQIEERIDRGNLSLQDRNRLTRDLVNANRALSEAQRPDTRAFDAFATAARDALARLTALKQAAQLDVQAPTSDAAERVNRLVQAQFLLNGGTRAYEAQLVRVRTAYANILGIIRESVAPTKEQLELARQLGAALEEAARRQLVTQAPVGLRNTLSELQIVANQYADAQAALQLARERRNVDDIKAAQEEIKGLQEVALAIQERIAQMVSTGALAPGVGDAILARMRELIQGMGIDMAALDDKTAEWITNLRKATDQIVNVAEGVLGILDGLGLVDDQTRKVLEGLVKVGKNLPGALSGDPSSIIGAIGGVVQTIGGLFGKSEEEKRREAVTRANTVALDRLRNEIGNIDLNVTGFDFATMQRVFAQINNPAQFLLKDNTKLGNRVNALLAANGLDIEDVKAAAEQLGLTFQNTAEFYRQFNAALQEVELTRFTDTFAGQMDKVRRSFEILGITDPAEKLQAMLDVITDVDVGSPAIRDAIAGLDLSTAEGLTEFQERLKDLFLNFETLTPEQLGGLTPTEFLDALAEAAGLSREALEQLTGTINDATMEMLNMPSGFRQARAEFLAAAAGTAQMTPFDGPLANAVAQPQLLATQDLTSSMQELVRVLSERLLPTPPPAPTQSAEEKAQSGITQYNVTVEAGAFRLDAGKNPTQQAGDFLRALRLKAHATTGDSTRLGDV